MILEHEWPVGLNEYWGLFFFDGKIAMGALIIFLLRI